MPIVFSIFFFFFPAGLVLYWVVNNILSIAPAVVRITRLIEGGGDAKADKKRIRRKTRKPTRKRIKARSRHQEKVTARQLRKRRGELQVPRFFVFAALPGDYPG